MGLTAVASSLRVFGNERVVFWRENSSGANALAYFLGKNIAQFPRIALVPLVFLSSYYTLVSPRGYLSDYYLVFLLLQFTAEAFGYLISIVVAPNRSQLAGVVIILVNQMFSGARPTLPELKNMFFPMPYIPYVSYIRWGQEAIYLNEMKRYMYYNVQSGMDIFGYKWEQYPICMILVPAIGIIIRILAYIALELKDKSKRK
eukprot:TRINITY_DN752_c2_g1_i1.p1 TRINITY_DN752_c2_g1~~TRINITY_DN752_c2_g1_i1.p1  ORF type:complete len:202 (+),score=48.80 TRINITY_DN752_c2_g1_i1:2-607(+)